MTSTLTAPLPTTGPSGDAPTPRRAALIAGIGYVALFALGITANFVVIEGLVVADDPAATASAIADRIGMFRAGTAAFLVIALVDVLVAWSLHLLLRRHGPDRSQLAAWMRILHSVFLGAGLVELFRVDALLSRAGAGADPLAVAVSIDGFRGMWMLGLAFFGIHLVLLAGLLVRAGAPAALGWLMGAAGVAYVVDTLRHVVAPGAEGLAAAVLALVVVTSIAGEGWLAGWLLVRGGRGRDVTPA